MLHFKIYRLERNDRHFKNPTNVGEVYKAQPEIRPSIQKCQNSLIRTKVTAHAEITHATNWQHRFMLPAPQPCQRCSEKSLRVVSVVLLTIFCHN